jgi:pyridoxal 5-phosphate dependent beta-lyase
VSELPHDDLAAAWRAAAAPCNVVHLDAAGCARQSRATASAVVGHLRREQQVGGYVAEAEVQPVIEQLRSDLGALLGTSGEHVALVESASSAFASLLGAWPLPPGARVGVVSTEYRTNLAALAAADVVPVDVPVDAVGHVDTARLADAFPLDLLTFPVVPSHVGIVQPVREVTARCRAAGVPVVLDVAQALGHVDLADADASAMVGTSRKWLRGPRGIGFLVVAPEWAERVRPPRLDHDEANVAGRLGLANAVAELRAAGPERVAERVAALGRLARHRLQDVGGWQVGEPIDEPSGLVTLRHPTADPVQACRALVAAGVVTSAPLVENTSDYVLRASFHAYSSAADVDALVASLAAPT